MKKSPTFLIILDGFGWRTQQTYNAVAAASMPHFKTWWYEYPRALLNASGTAVGLTEGYIGNSEVGHLTIGAGRVIKQPFILINELIADKGLEKNQTFIDTVKKLKKTNGTLHIMGLLSDAGVHAHINQMCAFIHGAKSAGIKKIIVHPFLDGRDTLPQSARTFLKELEKCVAGLDNVSIGSIHGRFYAMDRDRNVDRTQESYRILTQELKPNYTSWSDVINDFYAQGITDEFIPPTKLAQDSIQSGDGVIFTNFRPDRARQLTSLLLEKPSDLAFFLTPVNYGNDLKTTSLLSINEVEDTLLEKLSRAGKTIFSIAETEKYAHITYFFNGGREDKWPTETRVLIPSIPSKKYDELPCMSASEITTAVLESLQTSPADFYLINYANADMVAHSGNYKATIQACECIDAQLGKLYDKVVKQMDGTMFITADHGNAEDMYDEKLEQPRTAHTTNQVPFVWINEEVKGGDEKLKLRELADIAPFILKAL